MPLEISLPPVQARVDRLNQRYRHHGATSVLEHAFSDPLIGPVALVSSFGAESVVLLHLVASVDRTLPVLFLDTELMFEETLTYQAELADKLQLTNLQIIRPDRGDLFLKDNDGLLHQTDPDACCDLRKTVPLQAALRPFDGWITGRKRFQGGQRLSLDFFEAEGDQRIKINPLAHYTPRDIQTYITNNRLPRHPLVKQGYPSIGCAPCTSRVRVGEDARAGRWRGQNKVECGIHFVDGKLVRTHTPELTGT